MQGLRFLLILALAVLMDLGSPMLPEAPGDRDEFDEAAHGQRRVLRPVGHAAPEPAWAAGATTKVTAPRPAFRQPPPRPLALPVRKLPLLVPDPASASDDH